MKPRRPRGRPPLEYGVPTKELALSLALPHYEAVRAIAAVERVAPQAVIRTAVGYYLRLYRPPNLTPRAPRYPRSVSRPGRF